MKHRMRESSYEENRNIHVKLGEIISIGFVYYYKIRQLNLLRLVCMKTSLVLRGSMQLLKRPNLFCKCHSDHFLSFFSASLFFFCCAKSFSDFSRFDLLFLWATIRSRDFLTLGFFLLSSRSQYKLRALGSTFNFLASISISSPFDHLTRNHSVLASSSRFLTFISALFWLRLGCCVEAVPNGFDESKG